MTRILAVHRGVTAEEVLFVLNQQNTVPLHRLTFCVITGTYTPHRLEPQTWPFTPGEILVIDHSTDNGKEFLGKGRHPDGDGENFWEDSGWCYYTDDSLELCLELVELVRSDRPRGYYAWTADGWSYADDQERAHDLWAGAPDAFARVDDFTGRGHMAEYRERTAQA